MFMRSGLFLKSIGLCAVAVIALGAASVESRDTSISNPAQALIAENKAISDVQTSEIGKAAETSASTQEDAGDAK